MATERPNAIQWVWYAYGGRLPDRFAEWVLHDLTCRTWVLRHAFRALVQLSPFCLLVLLPGPLSIRIGAIVMGLGVGLFCSLCFAAESTEYRSVKHGHPPGTARETRRLRRDVRRAAKHGIGYQPWWE
ncbi:MAG: DUF5313 family protein [Saccharopolyspora rectivirgula]|jgi:hypothetical protein|uniref:DUF5313 family protein n=1 Tax=Saccharopolyspora rectivirgula TaxID=28042 RepID=UPI00240A84D6|nr:DUF5313 family protein [Saccharopolyspora rectivirgula]